MTTRPRWRQLSSPERQREYSPSSLTNDTFEPFVAEYVRRSAEARTMANQSGSAVVELAYGLGPAHSVDLVVPVGDGPFPLFVYIHGGYWQALSKRESFFCATDCLSAGVAFAAVDYTLAPDAGLDAIVDECRQALRVLRDSATENRIDPDQIVVAGSSAGGHLAAMMGLGLDDGWRPAAVVSVSGIFELEPLIGTSINEAVGLDTHAARRNSPMLADLAGFPPSVLAWGQIETDEFKRQSRHFASLLTTAGTSASTVEVAARNHFNVVHDLCDRQTILGAIVHELIETQPRLRQTHPM